MGKIIPSLEEINKIYGPLTEGENKFITFLENQLTDDWKIYFKPNINGIKSDIAIFSPKKGLMLYKIKEGDIKTIFKNAAPEMQLEQMNHCKNRIIKHLIPDIGEVIDETKENKPFGIVKTGIYTPNIKGGIARNLFGNPNFPKIIGVNDLFEQKLSKIIPGFMSKNQYMKDEWIEEIEFWLNPQPHQRKEVRYIELKGKQKDHAEPKEGHHRLHGPAGSGKTLVIAHRAAKLAQQGKKVLIITYNITLWQYIRDMIEKSPYRFDWRNITFNHFHGFCLDFLNELYLPKPAFNDNEEVYSDDLVNKVENGLNNGLPPEDLDNFMFDAILMDEAQDFKREWFHLLSKFLKERNEFFIAGDERQNIYNRKIDWMRGAWGKLDTVFRLPKKIGDVVNKFSEEFGLDSSVPIDNYIPSTLFDYKRPPQPHFFWENTEMNKGISRIKAGYDKIRLEQSISGNGNNSDIVILLPSSKIGLEAVEFFKNFNIDVNHIFYYKEYGNYGKFGRKKKSFWLNDKRLKMSTIHSFKGWEASNVIILIPNYWKEPKELDSIVYTAMTRTQENLMVFNTNERYFEFGDNLKSRW